MIARLRIALALALALVSALPLAGGTGAEPQELHLAKLDRPYTDFVRELAPVGEPGMSVRLSSPHQTLVLRDHRIRLLPQGDGVFSGDVELDVQGKGDLVADVELGPLVRQLVDEVVVPPQTVRAAGKARIRRVEGGYEIEALEAPRELRLAIQSRTINDILTLCGRASLLTLGALDCTSLEESLGRPAVPVPQGAVFHLADGDLEPADRAALDRLLAGR